MRELEPWLETTKCPRCGGSGYAGGAIPCICYGSGLVLISEAIKWQMEHPAWKIGEPLP